MSPDTDSQEARWHFYHVGEKSSVKTRPYGQGPPGENIKTTEYCGGWGWEEHLIHQREFKSVSTHNHEGEGLAGSPVVSGTPEISPLHQYRGLLYLV